MQHSAGLVGVAVGPLGWCVALGALVGGDPMLAVELAVAGLALVWALLVIRSVVDSRKTACLLLVDAVETVLFGVPCLVTPALGKDALVIGSIRPRIFVGRTLLVALSEDELQAVLYHEDHHRRTRAPIRAAALGAWLLLLGRSERIRGILDERLADLESLADADAIRRGSSSGSLARALLKADTSVRRVAFSSSADQRVDRLLDRAAGIPIEAAARLPYEWLPVAVVAVAALGCHVGL